MALDKNEKQLFDKLRANGVAGSKGIREEILAHAAAAHPHECCGLLLGQGTHITAIAAACNIHPSPRTHFEIDPQALVDAHRAARGGGLAVIGYYHSHPVGPDHPSATDQAQAAGDGRIWAIVALPSDVTFWRDDENGFTRLSYRCAGA